MDHPTPDLIADLTAPVRTSVRDHIHASRERIWHTLTDFDRWPAWHGAFRRVVIDGPVANGTIVTWTNLHGMTLRTAITRLDPHARIGWTGTAGAVTARYLLSLEACGTDRTLAIVEASIQSGLAALIPDFTERVLNAGLARGLAALRREAERRTL